MTTDLAIYTAKLHDGTTLKRTTRHEYTHAWALWKGDKLEGSGFSTRADMAVRAARRERNMATGRDDYNRCTSRQAKTPGLIKHDQLTLKLNGGSQAWDRKLREEEAKYTVEIVEIRQGRPS